MPPFDNYKKWCAENPDRFQKAQDMHQSIYGTTLPDIRYKLKSLETWLVANADNKKANKRDWYKFVLNWLKPKDWQRTASPEARTETISRPAVSNVRSNTGMQHIGNFLGRVFKSDSMLVTPQTTKPQTLAQEEAAGAKLPPITKLQNRCEQCGSCPVPILHTLGDKRICGLCYMKATE